MIAGSSDVIHRCLLVSVGVSTVMCCYAKDLMIEDKSFCMPCYDVNMTLGYTTILPGVTIHYLLGVLVLLGEFWVWPKS